MEPPILSERPTADQAAEGRRKARRRLVVADWGSTAELIVMPFEGPVCRGTEFSHRGTRWVITGERRDSRVLVAEPTSH
jgi:hypothetical protein